MTFIIMGLCKDCFKFTKIIFTLYYHVNTLNYEQRLSVYLKLKCVIFSDV